MIPLILTPFEKAIAQLQHSLDYCQSDLAKNDHDLFFQFRSASIQAFEYTFELSWKMLKRFLELTAPSPSEIDGMLFPELIRTGCEQGLLLSDVVKWKEFRKARASTDHTYNEDKADEVFAIIPAFLNDAQFLLARLQEKIAAS